MSSYNLRSKARGITDSNADLIEDSEPFLTTREENPFENMTQSVNNIFESPSRELFPSTNLNTTDSVQKNTNISPAELDLRIEMAVQNRMSELKKQKSSIPVLPSIDTNTLLREIFTMNNEFLTKTTENLTKSMTESFLKISDSLKTTSKQQDTTENLSKIMTDGFLKLAENLKAPKQQNFSKAQDFPKFDGTNFSDWYRLMKCQLACDPWTDAYDFEKQTWKESTDNHLLDNNLYKQVMRCLGSTVLAYISTRDDVTGKGLLLLKVLHSNYATRATRHYLNNLMEQFRNICRKNDETIDVYFSRFMTQVNETNRVATIIDKQTSISVAYARNHFILTLGKHFENSIKQYDEGHKKEWDNITWDELLDNLNVILSKYLLENPTKGGISKEERTGNEKTDRPTKEEVKQYQKKVVEAIKVSPMTESPALVKLQKECPNCCVFHKTKKHQSSECTTIAKIRKEALAEIAKANHAQADSDTVNIFASMPIANSDNDTITPVDHYPITASCTYKNNCQARGSDTMIADSGANFHMFNNRSFFKTLRSNHTSSSVLLPDGTSIPIKGVGTAYCVTEDGIKFELEGVLYVPSLQKSLFSLLIHLKTKDHSVEKVNTETMKLIFPTFHMIINMKGEMYVHIKPSLIQPSANRTRRTTLISTKPKTDEYIETGTHQDHIDDIQTQPVTSNPPHLNESVSNWEANSEISHVPVDPPHLNERVSNLEVNEGYENIIKNHSQITMNESNMIDCEIDENQSPSPIVTTSTPMNTPILRPVDKASSTLPATVTFNRDELHSCLGFRNIDSVVKVLDTHYQPTIKLTATPNDPVMDLGDVATMHKKNRNTEPVNRPETFGQVVHLDIAFGPDIGIGNVHYALILVDRYSRFTYTYPLVNLNLDIIRAFKQFFSDLGLAPKRIISDFDKKLIGTDASDFMSEHMTQVNAAPPGRQSQNGLVERHWQTITTMARNWLSSAQLPPMFWYMAIKRAAEITNYLPVKVDKNNLTPLELAYGIKPDLRNLFPMFSLAYVKKGREGDHFKNKFESMSEMMITVGKCSLSDGLLFYNPKTKSVVSSSDYKLDITTTSGPKFGMEYKPGNFIFRLDESTAQKSPIFKLNSMVFVHTHTPPHTAQVVGVPTPKRPDIYTVKHKDGSIIDYCSEILAQAPDSSSEELEAKFLPSWIKDGANSTLFLEDMDTPKHGKLYKVNNQWEFFPGTSSRNDPITLKDLELNVNEMLSSAQLFKGHAKFPIVYAAREQYLQEKDLGIAVARHVSAVGLDSLIPPPSLKKLEDYSENDKTIWLDAYKEEYEGLTSIPTWQVITESEFRLMRHLCSKPLPSMAISTIKFDENGKPKRAKYRIVVLGNIDTHRWENSQTSAPVMKHSELRLLVSIAIAHQRTMKNGDVKQAFVLSKLPPSETYIVRPPSNCPLSTPNTYWRLIQSLYGLKRAPKIWYEKMSKILTDIGLTSCPSAPCVFFGRIIPDLPPLYLGLYVDDFIYFSQSDEVEKEFEKRLATQLNGKVEFLGQVTQFLGVEFAWERQDNKLSVTLTQQAFIETLVETWNLQNSSVKCINTPYRTGIPIDTIPTVDMNETERSILRHKYQSITGSLNWLATTTRPDISTCVSLLAQYQSNPSPGHLEAAMYCIKYLYNTAKLGIRFTTYKRTPLEAFLQFPVKENLPLSMSDSNWGPLDASNKPIPIGQKPKELELFKSRSVSGFYVDLNGPLHWTSKRQGKTAVSSAEAEIYAANECTKYLLELEQVINFLECKDMFMPNANIVYVDNSACVDWSKNTTTKGLRHIQMRENHVRENIQDRFLEIRKIDGKLNLADLFTKEHKDVSHFTLIRDMMMHSKPTTSHHSAQSESSEGGVGGFS